MNRLYLRTSAALLALSLAGQLSLPLLAAPAGHFGAFVEWYADEQYNTPVTDSVPARGQTLYAKWLPNDYTIHFAAGGGSGSMAPQAGVWDTPLNLSPNAFHRAGHTFKAWENTYGDSKTYSDGEQVLNLSGEFHNDRITLYALWEPIRYTVHFDPTEGQGSMSSMDCTYDQDVVLSPSTLTPPEGKVFSGWALSENGDVRFSDGAALRNLAQEDDAVVTDEVSGASAVVSVSEEGGVRAEITVPASGIPAVLTIPCKASSSSVAVLLAADGSRSVLPWAVPVQDGLMLRVEQSCTVVLEDRPADYSDVSSQS